MTAERALPDRYIPSNRTLPLGKDATKLKGSETAGKLTSRSRVSVSGRIPKGRPVHTPCAGETVMPLSMNHSLRVIAGALLPLLLIGSVEGGQARLPSHDQIAVWTRQLSSPTASIRHQATAELARSGPAASAAVARTIDGHDYEVTYRAFHILATHFSSPDQQTHDSARNELTRLAKSTNAQIATQAHRTLATLIARPRARILVRLRNLGAKVKVNGDLGDLSTAIDIHLDEDWSGTVHDMRMLSRVHNLQTFSVQIEEDGEEVFAILHELLSLHTLALRGLKPTRANLDQLGKLTNLRSLDLSFTLIDDEGLEHLRALVNLEHLDLRDTLVTGVSINQLETLPKLRSLSLAMTRLTADDFQQVVNLTHLENLDVSRTQFTGHSLITLASLERLQSITAERARISRYDLEDFLELRRDVNVILTSNHDEQLQ